MSAHLPVVPHLLVVAGLCLGFSCVNAAEVGTKAAAGPRVAPASGEAQAAIKGFVPTKGFKVDLFAAEPHLANPVAFWMDEKGRAYVAETFRHGQGVLDIRGIMPWLDEDLASRSVDERLAEMKRHLGDSFASFTNETDQVRLVVDKDGDGRADHSTVFATGFNGALDGIGAGVISRGGTVWFANLPDLWKLRDLDGDGVADERTSLHHGYGVRVGFLGHDLHGLRFGPDGRLYFTIGDRGSRIIQNGRVIGDADTGTVFRCNPDGSELEVFAMGLRNPQELAFDAYGNLFTGDNNSDGGDRARWVYLLEGGDSGWRIGYQFLQAPVARGPWNAEKMWHPAWEGQPAHLVPPIMNLGDGPSGLAFYPGTGMPERYADHFFLCDFHGGKGSGIHAFALKPKGAGFEVVNRHNFLWEVLPTDVDFGVDGGLYYTDWVQGWATTGKGRIYRVYEPEAVAKPVVSETRRLLAEGFDKRATSELVRLLAHADQRVRQGAQFALAEQGTRAVKPLVRLALDGKETLARVHALWALEQIARATTPPVQARNPEALREITRLLADRDPEVRAQAARVLGDRRVASAAPVLAALLDDPSPRVRLFAAMALGKAGDSASVPALLALARREGDRDPLIRHGLVMSLVWINDLPSILTAAADSSPAVRLVSLLALRRLERPEIARFLKDPELRLVTEAARAINDVPIPGAMDDLGKLIDPGTGLLRLATSGVVPPSLEDDVYLKPLARRIINANHRLNTKESAARIVAFASATAAPELRREALESLASWPEGSGRDRITGLWRPVASQRSVTLPATAFASSVAPLLADPAAPVAAAAAVTAGKLGIRGAAPALQAVALDTARPGDVRVAALRSLALVDTERLLAAVEPVASDSDQRLRTEATRLRAQYRPADAVTPIRQILDNGSMPEKQSAFASLATIREESATALISEWLGRLLEGKVPAELRLDLVEAAGARTEPGVKDLLSRYTAAQPKDDPIAGFREVLSGGNAEAGRKVFFEKAEASCMRCHKVDGEGGEVGPELTGIGKKQDRAYIAEAILYPNRQIAAGFETVLVAMKDGSSYAGLVKGESDSELTLASPEDGILKLKKSDIAKRDKGLSGMPEGMGGVLTRRELRDLIEYLSQSK